MPAMPVVAGERGQRIIDQDSAGTNPEQISCDKKRAPRPKGPVCAVYAFDANGNERASLRLGEFCANTCHRYVLLNRRADLPGRMSSKSIVSLAQGRRNNFCFFSQLAQFRT